MAIVRDAKAFNNFNKNYWEYYRELEDEFLQTRKYVAFKEGNFRTYSVEFLKLFQAVCSEIDVLGKVMAKEVNVAFSPEDKQNNIMKWWFEIQDSYTIQDGLTDPQFSLNNYACILLDDLSLEPWANFRTEQFINKKGALGYRLVRPSQVPKWWSDYNKVKPNRTSLVTANGKDINYTTLLYFLLLRRSLSWMKISILF